MISNGSSFLLPRWVESLLKHEYVQTKRQFKAWRAIASLATMCSGLLHSSVDSPRDHECVKLTGWYDLNDVENGLKHPTIQTKRSLKAGRAIAPFVIVCSVLLRSWVESPRTHGYMNSACDLTYLMLKTA